MSPHCLLIYQRQVFLRALGIRGHVAIHRGGRRHHTGARNSLVQKGSWVVLGSSVDGTDTGPTLTKAGPARSCPQGVMADDKQSAPGGAGLFY